MATSLDANPTITLISAAILNAVRVDHGANGYDLSNVNAVVLGRYDKPPQIPFVALDLVGIDSDDEGPPMGVFERSAEFFVEGWAQSDSDTTVSSSLFGIKLAHNVSTALENAHRDSDGALKTYGVRRLYLERVEFANTEVNGRRIGHFRGVLRLTYTKARGL